MFDEAVAFHVVTLGTRGKGLSIKTIDSEKVEDDQQFHWKESW